MITNTFNEHGRAMLPVGLFQACKAVRPELESLDVTDYEINGTVFVEYTAKAGDNEWITISAEEMLIALQYDAYEEAA